ncbi:MAG: polysaccharide deacetylase family protein [Candidatus Omnitrophota bacterium]
MNLRQIILWIGIVLSLMSITNVQAQTVAERLGFPADAKLLIVHADDIGMCHAANAAFIESQETKIITCGSVMVPCPWFPEIAAYAKEHPDADLGIHLTHTSEWKFYRWGPLAERALVKGLLDPQGFLFRDVESVVQSASAAEIEAEIRAQLDQAIAFGIKPTHFDSHMGTVYAKIEYIQAAMKVAEEYDIPFMLFNPTPQILEQANNLRDGLVQISDTLQKQGVPLLDALYSIKNTPVEEAENFYRNLIADLKPGVSELIIHPSKESDELQAITGSHKQRNADFKIFTNPGMKQYIESQGVRLIGWKDLNKLWKSRTK